MLTTETRQAAGILPSKMRLLAITSILCASPGAQPRFLFQPHLAGGAVAMPAFTLEVEGTRGLVQHLKAALLESGRLEA